MHKLMLLVAFALVSCLCGCSDGGATSEAVLSEYSPVDVFDPKLGGSDERVKIFGYGKALDGRYTIEPDVVTSKWLSENNVHIVRSHYYNDRIVIFYRSAEEKIGKQ